MEENNGNFSSTYPPTSTDLSVCTATMAKRYFRISGIKYRDLNQSEKDFHAWQYLLESAVKVTTFPKDYFNLNDEFCLFNNLLSLRNEHEVTITREGKLDFSFHFNGEQTDEERAEWQECFKAIEFSLYEMFGEELASLIKQASQLVEE